MDETKLIQKDIKELSDKVSALEHQQANLPLELEIAIIKGNKPMLEALEKSAESLEEKTGVRIKELDTEITKIKGMVYDEREIRVRNEYWFKIFGSILAIVISAVTYALLNKIGL